MEETINLKELFQMLKKRLALICIIVFVSTVASGLISFFVLTPMYQTSTQLVVSTSSNDNQINNAEIQGNIQLINTYNVIMTSPAILDQVIEQLDLDRTVGQLQNQISVSNATNSQVMVVTVTDEDPNIARDIANTTAAVFQQEVGNIMNVDNVSILATAEVTEGMRPVSPNPTLNMAIVFVVGLMIGVGLAFLLEYVDNTVKTEQDIETLLDLPVLGAVPMIKAEDMKGNHHRAMAR